jgi:phage tail sheath protein FI
MPEYLSPGVYVEEVDTGSKPIEGVSTSTVGMVGITKRGPSTGLPVLVTSFADFRRKFGSYFDFGSTFTGHQYLPYAVEGFFVNGGKRAYIKRVLPTGASKSQVTATGGIVTRLKSDLSSSSLNKVKLVTLRGVQVGSTLEFTQVKDGITSTPVSRNVTAYDRTTNEVTLNSNLPSSLLYEAKYTTVKVTSITQYSTFTITAKNEGSWGKGIVIKPYHESAASSDMDSFISGAVNNNQIKLKSTKGFYVDAYVEIDRGQNKIWRKVTKVDGYVITVNGAALTSAAVAPQAPATTTRISTCEFGLSVSYDTISEDFSGLTLENIPGHYYLDIINNGSDLIDVGTPPANHDPFRFPSGDDGLYVVLGGGSDGTSAPTDDSYKGVDNGPGQRTGIQALIDIDEVSILAVPGITSQVVQDAMINHCEDLKDRFAVLDPAPKAGNQAPDLNDIQTQRQNYDTKYAAIYYPRILIRDPLTKTDMPIPPSGHVLGIYARSDIERGVHKAPANEVVRGITGFEVTINKGEQDILNPKPNNINVLRDFRKSGRGYRVWGARCITSDPDWKYINVRRLFIFVEESIEEGTQWVVFEPNDEPTWARVRRTVSNFLTNIWRDGALQGSKPEEAFFVKCDRTTMTQTDIDNGKLIMEIGIAPVKPAEFVIFRIGQWSGGSEVEEV